MNEKSVKNIIHFWHNTIFLYVGVNLWNIHYLGITNNITGFFFLNSIFLDVIFPCNPRSWDVIVSNNMVDATILHLDRKGVKVINWSYFQVSQEFLLETSVMSFFSIFYMSVKININRKHSNTTQRAIYPIYDCYKTK